MENQFDIKSIVNDDSFNNKIAMEIADTEHHAYASPDDIKDELTAARYNAAIEMAKKKDDMFIKFVNAFTKELTSQLFQKAKDDFVYGEEAANAVEQKMKPVCDFRKSKEDENKEMAYSIVGSTSILTTDTLFESLIKIAGWKDTSHAKSIVACLEKIAQIETTDKAVIQKVTDALKDILK